MNISEHAISCEVRKLRMSQSKDAMTVTFEINPVDLPKELMLAPLGTRYMLALVEVGDDEMPTSRPEVIDGKRRVKSAVMLCKNEAFHRFLSDVYTHVADESEATQALRDILGIESRSELKELSEASTAFSEVLADFELWRMKNPHKASTPTKGEDQE